MRRAVIPPITWLTVPQAAERLDACPSTVGNLIADGTLDATRVGAEGGDWRIQADVVRAYAERGLSQTTDRFDRALTVIARRHAQLRLVAQSLRETGEPGAASASDDAADEVCTLLVLMIADALGRGMPADVAHARAVESADFLMEAARTKLAGAGAR